jgi:hypothetical protein
MDERKTNDATIPLLNNDVNDYSSVTDSTTLKNKYKNTLFIMIKYSIKV